MLKTQRTFAGSLIGAQSAANRFYRRFERLPAWLGALLGVMTGAGLAALFLELRGLEGLLAYAVLLCFALWLGLNAGWVLDLKLPDTQVSAIEVPVVTPELKDPEKPASLLDMVAIPGSRFLMGGSRDDPSAYDSERPQHPVRVASFLMSKYPVTVEDYRTVMTETPSEWVEQKPDDRCPANYITWLQAVEFCNALSEREAFKPCYKIEGRSVEWLRNRNGYRLPTEAEWEYAARAGTQSVYFFGDDAARLGEYAWYSENSGKELHPVGTLKPNPFGLHDLLGNVWEWCWDWYGPYDATQNNPAGPESGEYRRLRGGSAWNVPGNLRSANRIGYQPEVRDEYIGFRCVRSPAAST
ncbi:MAG: formylglycine-generating enzyme family protein [Methylococcales bacterium]